MSVPKYQNESIFEPDFQSVCGSECAIADPDEPVEFNGKSFTRRARFEASRDSITADLAVGRTVYMPEMGLEHIELFMSAGECADRIASGDCSKFLLNTGQIPNFRKGMLTYKAVELILNIRSKEE